MCPPMRTHWRHMEITTEFVLPLAHPSPQPKHQIDRFSRFCTAQGRKSLVPILYNGRSPEIVPTHGGSGRHLTHDSLGPSEPATRPNGISIGSAVFAQITAECPYALQWDATSPLKITPFRGDPDSGPHLIHGLDQLESSTKRHLYRFSRFCMAHYSVTDIRPTDRPTDHARYS